VANKKTYNIAVVGAGITGSTLAFQLKKFGYSVLLIDKPELSSSSRIAAGVYNPIVFKRTTLAWKAKETILSCIDFYNEAGKETGINFHIQTNLYRILSGYEEQNEWVRKSAMPVYDIFMDDVVFTTELKNCKTPYGYTRIKNTGYILTNEFMQAIRNYIGIENCLDEQFEHSTLKIGQSFTYGDFSFDKIVFCEGHLVSKNPWFNHIQLYPVKGEIIEIENKSLEPGTLYSGGVYLLAQNNGLIKIGGTYDWTNLDELPTESGRNELVAKTTDFFDGTINVVSQKAGIRPAVKDRRPVVGQHHEHKNMYVLNGMGTKGVSLAPWCARQLQNFIEENIPLEKEIDVERFRM
jgi:glycine oxidase